MDFLEEDEDFTIQRALAILRGRLQRGDTFSDADAIRSYLRLQARFLPHEVFSVMCLDTRSRFIGYDQLFRGTLSRCSVFTREVVKHALVRNAAMVVLHHNHPSGCCRPSQEDEAVTRGLKLALALVEVRVMDHVITSDEETFSIAERNEL